MGDQNSAVASDLHSILSREGVRRGKAGAKTVINDLGGGFGRADSAVNGGAGRMLPQGFGTLGGKYFVRDGKGICARYADDGYAALAHRRGNGGNGIK